jgi:hypothetical protein
MSVAWSEVLSAKSMDLTTEALSVQELELAMASEWEAEWGWR